MQYTRHTIVLFCLLFPFFSHAQQFDNLHIEKRKIDENNAIFTVGTAFVYQFEIIENDTVYHLLNNTGNPEISFDLVPAQQDSTVQRFHLLVPTVKRNERTNKRQTEIMYSFEPLFKNIYQTGIVENDQNCWIHPPRNGFFGALETCPFPYVKFPLEPGKTWIDQLSISPHWAHPKWGEWQNRLLLNFRYSIDEKTQITWKNQEIDVFKISSFAESSIGKSTLVAYFSEQYGFVRLEYTTATQLKINIWMVEHAANYNFNTFDQVVDYIELHLNQ